MTQEMDYSDEVFGIMKTEGIRALCLTLGEEEYPRFVNLGRSPVGKIATKRLIEIMRRRGFKTLIATQDRLVTG